MFEQNCSPLKVDVCIPSKAEWFAKPQVYERLECARVSVHHIESWPPTVGASDGHEPLPVQTEDLYHLFGEMGTGHTEYSLVVLHKRQKLEMDAFFHFGVQL